MLEVYWDRVLHFESGASRASETDVFKNCVGYCGRIFKIFIMESNLHELKVIFIVEECAPLDLCSVHPGPRYRMCDDLLGRAR